MSVNRVTYTERQPISRATLADEQAYQIAMRRRHNLAQHDWGIVAGLDIVPSGAAFVLHHGVAIDGFGRELIVPDDIAIPADALAQLQSDNIAAWLIYALNPGNEPRLGPYPCGPGEQDRAREEARLRLEAVASLNEIDGRFPPQVSLTDLAFGPQDDPPDDPGREWPVFLGGLSRPSSTAAYRVVTAGRTYAFLRGELISAASGRGQVQVGAEASGDQRRFAALVPDEKLSIDVDGNSTLRGNTRVYGEFAIESAAPESAVTGQDLCAGVETLQQRFWGVDFKPIAPPKTAAPWQVYHALDPAGDQLRFEFLNPGKSGDQAGYTCAIGVNRGTFSPCVSVDAQCNVTFHGDVTLEGSLIWGPAKPDFADPRFQAEMLSAWVQGMVGNTTGLAKYYGGALELSFANVDVGVVGAPVACTLNVKNTGPFVLTKVQLTEAFSVAGATGTPPLPAPFTLAPGATLPVPRTYTGPVAGPLTVSVAAQGVAVPNGYEVRAAATHTIQMHAAANVTVTVTGLGQTGSAAGTPQNFTVAVTNHGAEAVTVNLITITSSLDLPVPVAIQNIPLAAGATHNEPGRVTPTPTADATLTITATADVTGPGHDTIHPSGHQSVLITVSTGPS